VSLPYRRAVPNLTASLAAAAVISVRVHACLAQTEYHDLPGELPTYIEGASVVPRYAFEWDMAPLTVTEFSGALTRFLIEPALSYGILPRTDLELTAPYIFREPGVLPRQGLTGFGIGAMYNFNYESRLLPAIAIKGNVLFPGAGATTFGTLYAGRAIATRSFGQTRLHFNLEYSTYPVAAAYTPPGCGASCQGPPPSIPDTPCGVIGLDSATANAGAPLRAPAGAHATGVRQASGSQSADSSSQTGGTLVVLGLAADRSFPLWSTMLVGDVYVTRYTGTLPRPNDWMAELGFRKQISPRLVLDAGAGRRFAGLRLAWIATLGTTYVFALPALMPEGQPDEQSP
jgi:hypothetical protein